MMIPANYAEWRQCIEVSCGLRLTAEFIQERLAALRNPADAYTRAFTSKYGAAYLQQVISWYEQALASVGRSTV
jgi:hypothetical protein